MSLSPSTIQFIHFMVDSGVLSFGDFTGKSGRKMPYFMNAGRYDRGSQLDTLGALYADRLQAALGAEFDVLFGPAYKGIPLCVATAMQLSRRGHDVGFCFNRKEAKDHGEGGVLVGHQLKDGDRVVIVEDVTTAGTSIRETVPLLLAAANIKLVALIVSVDRQERGQTQMSALSEVRRDYGMETLSLVTIDQVVEHLREHPVGGKRLIDAETDARIAEYRARYGASPLEP